MMTLAGTDMDGPALAGSDLVMPQGYPARWLRRRASRKPLAFSHIPGEVYVRPFYRQRHLTGRYVWLNDPAAIKRVLVDNVANYPKTALELRFFASMLGAGLFSTEGDIWRRHRRIMASSFDPRSVAGYAPTIAATVEAHLAAWDARGAGAGATFDVMQDMTGLTLQIIARTMFSTGADHLAPLVDAAVRDGMAALNGNLLDLLPITGPARFTERERTMRRIFAPLDIALEALIAERERNLASAPNDLLTRLIAAKDTEGGAPLTAGEVRDEMITIFLAGHETTAVTMSWVWYLLSQHPAAEARLHAELDQVLGERAATAEDVARLPYARMVVEESMRLYPAAPGVSNRGALAADEVAGQKISRGDIMLISSWVLHRNPKFWDRPERFDPERFSPERSVGRPRFAYLPFGAGPHVCIGMGLAMTEAILILATLARRYRLELAPGQGVELQQLVTLRPRGGLRMVLQPRG
jgi:cytochrome P450